MKKEDKETALSPKQFRKIGTDKFIDISTLDESDEAVYNSVYYKEMPLVTGDMDESIIVTYSPKYKAYQQKIRSRQLDRAQKIVDGKIKKRKGKNQNDPARFVKETKFTEDGEIAEKTAYELDQDRIHEEAKYDGFYAVVTNLEDNVEEILKINKQRWEIEENFRIMKTDFEARPVYVRREDRIKSHFLTCYISLLVYRLLEKKLDDKYTCEEILSTLRGMNMTLLSGNCGYVPSYKRTELTDSLHDTFGFRTDYEFITKASMRTIIKNTKNSTKGKK
jgi:transposase